MTQFALNTLGCMADDYDRLLKAAKELLGWGDAAATARGLGLYDQILTNWKSRGIPRDKIMDLAEKLGCNPYWLRDGTGEMVDYNKDAKIKTVVIAMQNLPEYKKDILVQTSSALAEQPAQKNNGTQ